MDIALDPFPYNGTTTTCEALWMGVPVITLRGHRHAGRVGASLLTQIGLTDLIANSIEEYVEIAVALAGNSGRLHRPALRFAPAHGSVHNVRRGCLRVQNGSCVSLHVAPLVCSLPHLKQRGMFHNDCASYNRTLVPLPGLRPFVLMRK